MAPLAVPSGMIPSSRKAQIVLLTIVAPLATAHFDAVLRTHDAEAVLSEQQLNDRSKGGMMRRETPGKFREEGAREPKPAKSFMDSHEASDASDHMTLAINAKGTQARIRADRDQGHSAAEVQTLTGSEQDVVRASSGIARQAPRRSDSGKRGEVQKESSSKAAMLAEQDSISTGLKEDTTHTAPSRLSDTDEELYNRLFPEENAERDSAAASALEIAAKKSFRIKVPVSGGKRLCLTQATSGFKVRAEPCRRNSKRQKWYWMGEKLKNLSTKNRCLGVHELTEASRGLSKGNALTMAFDCSDHRASLTWAVDELGRLESTPSSQCMAINEQEDFNALVMPCERSDVQKENKEEEE